MYCWAALEGVDAALLLPRLPSTTRTRRRPPCCGFGPTGEEGEAPPEYE